MLNSNRCETTRLGKKTNCATVRNVYTILRERRMFKKGLKGFLTAYSSWCGQLDPDCHEFTGLWEMKNKKFITRDKRSRWRKIWSYDAEAVMNLLVWKLIP